MSESRAIHVPVPQGSYFFQIPFQTVMYVGLSQLLPIQDMSVFAPHSQLVFDQDSNTISYGSSLAIQIHE